MTRTGKSTRLTEDDLKQFEANLRKIKGVGRGVAARKRAVVEVQVSERPGAASDSPPSRVWVKPVSSPAPSPTSQSFFVPGPLPGANDIIRKHWRVYSKLKQEWGLTIARCLMVAKLKPVQSCSISYHWVEPTPVRGHIRDRDNIRFGAKFINDAIVTHGILLDDGPDGVVSLSDMFTYNGITPGVLVTLTEE